MSRSERVAERIKTIISEILIRDIDDSRLGFVTITKVSVSPDLVNAVIYVSVMGDDSKKSDSMQALKSATKFIKGILGDKLDLRHVPTIDFTYDDSLEKASRVWSLMSKLNGKNSRSDK